MNDVTSRDVADQAREISVFVNPGFYFSHTNGSHAKPTAAAWPLFQIRKSVHVTYP